MSFSYKMHEDVPMRVMSWHIRDAVCSSISECTLAKMGQDHLGVPVQVGYHRQSGKVLMLWVTADQRRHSGILEPTERAVQVLLLTDDSKRSLTGVCPPEGIALMVTRHRSRPVRVRTPEQKRAERERREELAQLRADGLAPPAVPRQRTGEPMRRMPRASRLARGRFEDARR